jgi:hypothetical protein
MVSAIPQSMADHEFNPTSGLTRSPQVGFLDIEGAMTPSEVANALGLTAIKHKYQIFKTSAIKGEGLNEAMEW